MIKINLCKTLMSSVVLTGLLFFTGCDRKSSYLPDRVVVKVNNHSLTASTFSHSLIRKLQDYDAFSVKDSSLLQQVKNQITNEFILATTIDNWAKANNVFVRKEALDKEVNFLKSNYPDHLSFRRALSEQRLSFEQWKNLVRQSLLQKLVIKKVAQSTSIPSDKEIERYYNENRDKYKTHDLIKFQHLVLDSEQSAEKVLKQARKGSSFAELAFKYSLGPESLKKGETSWIKKGDFPVFDSAFNKHVGFRSKIIKSPYGYHIYKIIGKKRGKKLSKKAAKKLIINELLSKRQEALYTAWLEKQLRKSNVYKDEVFIGGLKVETRGR